jgi:hypothetical protein
MPHAMPHAGPRCFAYTQVTSYRLALTLQSEVINGPTTSHGLPPFRWAPWDGAADGASSATATADAAPARSDEQQYTHEGHPDTFDFEWERMAADELPLPPLVKAP